MTQTLAAADTLPKLLLRNYQQWGNKRIAFRKKELGLWREYTWEDCYRKTRAIFLGLLGLGLEAGNGVSIVADSSPQWLWCELAVQTARGIVTGLNPGGSAEETKGLMVLGRTRFVMAQDQEQVDRLLEIRKELPALQRVIYWNERGLRGYNNPVLMSLDQLIRLGEEHERNHPGDFERKLTHCKSDDIAMMIFTQGPKDALKVVPATHRFLLTSVSGALATGAALEDEHGDYVSVIMPGWYFEQTIGFARCLVTGSRLNFPERPDTAAEDFREIAPHTLVYPSKVWNDMAVTVKKNIRKGSWMKRGLFDRAISGGSQPVDGSPVLGLGSIIHRLDDFLVLRPLRDKHGFNRLKAAYAAGDPVDPETLGFFHAVGVNLRQIYGSTKEGITTSLPPEERKIK